MRKIDKNIFKKVPVAKISSPSAAAAAFVRLSCSPWDCREIGDPVLSSVRIEHNFKAMYNVGQSGHVGAPLASPGCGHWPGCGDAAGGLL